tara:strand:+ start:350 stop:553 length:204 start_codon:yes stop_codon:yes gene_type:complete
MSSFKGFLAIAVWTMVAAFIAVGLDVGAHHTNLVWALGTAVGFLVWLVSAVALFFGVAGDDPFKWEK